MDKKVKKTVGTVALATTLIFMGTIGTYSKYEKKGNLIEQEIKASNFDIAFKIGNLDNNGMFKEEEIKLNNMHPGCKEQIIPIVVLKNYDNIKTDVPVEYSLNLGLDEGEILKDLNRDGTSYKSPISFTLQRKNNKGEFVNVMENFKEEKFTLSDNDENNKPQDIEEFRIIAKWNTYSNENDTFYAGKNGKLNVGFHAVQLINEDGKEQPGNPEQPEKPENPGENPEKPGEETKQLVLNNQWFYYSYLDNKVEKKYATQRFPKITFSENNGAKAINFGGLIIRDPKGEVAVNMANLTFTQVKDSNNEYIVTTNNGKWNGKIFKLSLNIALKNGKQVTRMILKLDNNNQIYTNLRDEKIVEFLKN